MKTLFFFLFLLPAVSAFSVINTWKAPAGYASNKYYQVKVNGTPVQVFDTPIASYAIFDFQGEANVEVNTMYDVH